MFKVQSNNREQSHAVRDSLTSTCTGSKAIRQWTSQHHQQTRRPAHTQQHREPTSFTLPIPEPLRVHFSQCSLQLQPFLSPSINHCHNFPFPPSGRAMVCSTFHRAAQPQLPMEICIRKSFASEEILHHSNCHSRMPLLHQSCFEENHFPLGMK